LKTAKELEDLFSMMTNDLMRVHNGNPPDEVHRRMAVTFFELVQADAAADMRERAAKLFDDTPTQSADIDSHLKLCAAAIRALPLEEHDIVRGETGHNTELRVQQNPWPPKPEGA
jgi:hypothetical protein